MADQLKITLSHYEGPLDLLLDLIRRQKIDIYDIPIAQVTSQYLDFLHLMKEMNVDVAAEFLVIAAQLIYIKSRLLLPPDPDADPEEDDDPRGELVRRLLEYEQFKNAAEMLYQREQVEKAAWTRAGVIDIDDADLEPEVTATLFDMLDIFRDVLKRFEERPPLDVFREEFFNRADGRLCDGRTVRRRRRHPVYATTGEVFHTQSLDHGVSCPPGTRAAVRHLPGTEPRSRGHRGARKPHL